MEICVDTNKQFKGLFVQLQDKKMSKAFETYPAELVCLDATYKLLNFGLYTSIFDVV